MGKKAKPEAEEAAGAPGEEPVTKPAVKATVKEEKADKASGAEEPAEIKSRKKKSEDSEDEEGGFGDEDSDEGGEEESGEAGEPAEEAVQPRVLVKVTLPEERWSMTIKIDAEVQETLDLIDLQKLFGAYMTIKKKFFDDLLTTMPGAKHYSAGKAIEAVVGFDKQDWTKNSWILVMAKEAKNKVVFWLLFKRMEDLSGMLVAIGPNAFAESIMGLFPDDPDSRNEYLKKLMIWLTIEPSRWKSVGVFIPNWL